ncbi:MAG: DUF1800 domain-containing protein [Rhodobacterales bacterium]|nr:DUF1800 domain-containing protein [Rhodobacterales bacterium]
MITRRMFHTRLMAALTAALVPLPRLARASAGDIDRLWLNRLTFGATPAEAARIARLGRDGWLDWQLAQPVSDPDLDSRLAAARLRIAYEAGEDEDGNHWPARDEARPLAALAADPADLVHLLDWGPGKGMDFGERIRPAQEVIAAAPLRAVHATAQLREVMTQFWHDHFNVNSGKDESTAVFFARYDATLRTHAFGNFRALLGEVARSPAMLYYLNNADSIASPANENYARELLELHTLGAENYLNDLYSDWHLVPLGADGVATGYLDLDVYEVARAFTGWSVGDGRWISEGEEAPRSGAFAYVTRWHDPYQKRILGREFPPNRAPMADGDEVLDLLSRHPGTATFVCRKIARRFLADDPDSALVARLAAVFLAASDAPDQIAQVIRALVLSPEFEAPPTKLRRPFEFMTALYRATGAEVVNPENAYHWQLGRAGWLQHECGPPTGHRDRIEAWTGASSLNRLVDLALFAHEDWFGTARVTLSDLAVLDETARAFLIRHAAALAPDAAETLADEVGAIFFGDALDGPADQFAPEDRQGAALAAVAFAALTPEFLLR